MQLFILKWKYSFSFIWQNSSMQKQYPLIFINFWDHYLEGRKWGNEWNAKWKTFRYSNDPNIARYHFFYIAIVLLFFIYSNLLVRSGGESGSEMANVEKNENVDENDMNIFRMKIRQSSSFNLFRYDDIRNMKYPWNFSIVSFLSRSVVAGDWCKIH